MKCPKMQVTFTPEQLEKLKIIAQKSGNSVSSIIRTLVAEYLCNINFEKEALKNGSN